jgi:hypothetical protein
MTRMSRHDVGVARDVRVVGLGGVFGLDGRPRQDQEGRGLI